MKVRALCLIVEICFQTAVMVSVYFLIRPVTGIAGCVLRDKGSYVNCNLSSTQVFFCGAGRLGKKLAPCHSIPGKRGYCCQSGVHAGCKTGAKYAKKWYYRGDLGRFVYCNSIYVRPAASSQCVVSIYTNGCPFLKRGDASKNYVSSGYRVKSFSATQIASSPDPQELSYDSNSKGWEDDESPLWINDDHKRLFTMPNEQTACPQSGNDFCGKAFTTDQFIDFSLAIPAARPEVAGLMTAPPYNVDSASDPVAVVNALKRGITAAFNDRSCETGTTEERQSCCSARQEFWADFCTLNKISIKRKSPGNGECELANPDDTKCPYTGFLNDDTVPSSTAISVNYEDPDLNN